MGSFNRYELDPDEREAFKAILNDAIDKCDEDDKAAARVANAELLAQEGTWVAVLRRQAFLAALQEECKRLVKARHKVLVDYRGQTHSRTQARSIRVRDEDTGEITQQLTLIAEMTWDEVATARQEAQGRLNDALVERAMLDKVEPLHDLYPESTGVADALAAHGMALEEFLAGAA